MIFDDLQPLIAPRSIAIVGASTSNPYASRLLANLGDGGFAGRLYHGKMVDVPVYKRALVILARAQSVAERNAGRRRRSRASAEPTNHRQVCLYPTGRIPLPRRRC